MGDSSAGGAAFLSGEEIVNDERTLAYLNAGYGPPSLQVKGCCSCPRIRELIECNSDAYRSPTLDPAPWYDSSVPESADFAGFLTSEFVGLGSTFTRNPIEKVTGGAFLGRLQAKPRTLTWKGFLFGRSDCAVRFGLSWLTSQLRGQGCVCGGEDLDLLVCCPELIDSPPISGCGSLPAINRPSPCPPFSQPDAFRTLKNVGLVAGPVIQSQRRVGCGLGCGSSSCSGEDTLIMEVEFSLLAGNPYLYGCPVCLCVDQTFPVDPDCATDALWLKVFDDTLVTLRPDATNSTIGTTITGASSVNEALASPDSDASYVTINQGQVVLDFDTSVIPLGYSIKSVTPRIRYSGSSVDVQLQNATSSIKTDNLAASSTPIVNYSGTAELTNFSSLTWIQSDIDSIRLSISDSTSTTIVYEAYIDVKYNLVSNDDCVDPDCVTDSDCSDDEIGCPKAVLPVIPAFVDGCFCDPLVPIQTCCEIPSDAFGQFFDGAPVIEIFSGSSVMRSTTIRFFDNPQGLPCCDAAENPCRDCDSLQIRYIPASSTLTIDGTTRTVTLLCPGSTEAILADHLTVTPFTWPILQCVDFCICTETDGATVADDATVSILVTPREM